MTLHDDAFVAHTFHSRTFLGENTTRHASAGWTLAARDLTERGHLRSARLCVRGMHNVSSAPQAFAPAPAADADPQMLRLALWIAIGIFGLIGTAVFLVLAR